MINENIKNARKAKGLSQEQMAIELNVVRQTVSKWEKGLSVPDADILMKMADLLEIPVGKLLGINLQDDSTEDMAKELAQLNEQLAIKNQKENLYLQVSKKRGMILLLSFLSMFVAMRMKNELISFILIGGCLLVALIILYRNLTLFTRVTTIDIRYTTLKIATIFNITIILLVVTIVALDKSAFTKVLNQNDEWIELMIISVIILFGGYISPKLPFNRHTGLRLPWTVHDEDTWNVAHNVIRYISLPLLLLYLAAFFTVGNLEVISVAAILLWIGIPGMISFIFWVKKNYGLL